MERVVDALALLDHDLALLDGEAHGGDGGRRDILGLLRQRRVIGGVGDHERRQHRGHELPLVSRERLRQPVAQGRADGVQLGIPDLALLGDLEDAGHLGTQRHPLGDAQPLERGHRLCAQRGQGTCQRLPSSVVVQDGRERGIHRRQQRLQCGRLL